MRNLFVLLALLTAGLALEVRAQTAADAAYSGPAGAAGQRTIK
ncbi:MAG TPA: hypothetical protein VIX37_07860 [Candidatus Sulfotelmatobacter sp.]